MKAFLFVLILVTANATAFGGNLASDCDKGLNLSGDYERVDLTPMRTSGLFLRFKPTNHSSFEAFDLFQQGSQNVESPSLSFGDLQTIRVGSTCYLGAAGTVLLMKKVLSKSDAGDLVLAGPGDTDGSPDEMLRKIK